MASCREQRIQESVEWLRPNHKLLYWVLAEVQCNGVEGVFVDGLFDVPRVIIVCCPTPQNRVASIKGEYDL